MAVHDPADDQPVVPRSDEHNHLTDIDDAAYDTYVEDAVFWDDVALGWEDLPVDVVPNDAVDDSASRRRSPAKLSTTVLATLRATLSAVHGMSPQAAGKLVSRITASPRVLGFLSSQLRRTYDGVFEVLVYESTITSSGQMNLSHLPVLEVYSAEVAAEIDIIRAEIGVSTPVDPHAAWFSLVESVQRHLTRTAAVALADAIDEGAPLKELLPKHAAVEPPTTQKATIRTGHVRSADQVVSELRSESAGRPAFRFSSGLPTLDLGYTGAGEEKGFIAPGQFIVVMGPTGTGKTSFSNTVTPAFGQDLRNWGLNDAFQVLFHTEEESIDKIRGFRMDVGQKFHHLARNLVIDAIGTSRRRMAETLYDLVISADEQSRSTRRPITDFLPYIVQLDYIQSVQDVGEDEKDATARTAEFLLRGVAAWNAEEMAKFSGVEFRSYAGMSWPSGMENHRVAVIGYAQLVKISDESLFFKPDKRGIQLSDFVLLDDKDEPLWDVRENDLRLFGKNQMRGSGIIAQNAHAIVILHRSVPYNNPARRSEDGRMHLVDTRARILFDKSRSGSRLPYAPMRFDVQSTGFRAQYVDEVAERALASGKLGPVDPCYTEAGDPMLPPRPKRSRLASARY